MNAQNRKHFPRKNDSYLNTNFKIQLRIVFCIQFGKPCYRSSEESRQALESCFSPFMRDSSGSSIGLVGHLLPVTCSCLCVFWCGFAEQSVQIHVCDSKSYTNRVQLQTDLIQSPAEGHVTHYTYT